MKKTMGSIQELYPYPPIERGYREPSKERELNLMRGTNDTNKWWYLLIGVAVGYFLRRGQ